MKRRALFASMAVSALLPDGVRAQQSRRIGVLMDLDDGDPEGRLRFDAIKAELARLGWADGVNAQIDVRWAGGVTDRMRVAAAELVALKPDAVLAYGSAAVAALRQATTIVPIVFVSVVDPVGAGFVASLARPGGNVTGFMLLEFSAGAKWLDLLKDAAPSIARVGVLRDATLASGRGQFEAISTVATSVGIELTPIDMLGEREIEQSIEALALGKKSGLIVTAGTLTILHRDLILALAAKYRLPAIYSNRLFVSNGGLLSYSPYRSEQYQQAASYISRILKGAKPADLPVQAPTKYELAVNLRTARSLGLAVPPSILASADELIE